MKKHKSGLNDTLKQEFRKDLELFEYFLVLLNHSSPIRNVELMWAEDLDTFDIAQCPPVNTGEALVQLQPAGAETPGRSSPSPSTYFCDLVHGFGAHEDQTCARSDKPAKEHCRASGRSQVYPCHVGLTDIAVPVFCEERYIGTLFSGQVLTEHPTAEGFARVRDALATQQHIDFARLEEAYLRVPVVTTAQISEMVRMMEVFARYLGNAWMRLEIMSEFQQMRERELSLDRRELAEKLLAGHTERGSAHVEALARSVGLDRFPNRVLLLRLRDPAEQGSIADPNAIAGQLALSRVSHVIEDRCRTFSNTLATVVAPGEMCIFTNQSSRSATQETMLLEEMAQSLLRAARSQGMHAARIAISSHHAEISDLLVAYHEAASALGYGQSSINWFKAAPERGCEPNQMLVKVLKAILSADPVTSRSSAREFLAAAAPPSSGMQPLQQERGLLTWACEHLSREVIAQGAGDEAVNGARERAIQVIMSSASAFGMCEAFRSFVEQLRLQIVHLFSQREQKIVNETQRLVREIGPEKVNIQQLAQSLKLSAGHLGRVYSRTAGHTLEEFLIRQKLEMSKRLLLDPRLQVAEVADRCGFCNPAYFASVFKRYMQCTPRAYAKQPQHWGEPASIADTYAASGLHGAE